MLVSSRRINLKCPVEFRRSYGRINGKAFLKNISLTGAFLDFSQTQLVNVGDLKIRDRIVLFFSVSDRDRKVVSSVVWQNEIGCGVQFHPSNQRDFRIVDDFIFFVELGKEKRKKVFLSILDQLNAIS